MSSAKDEIGEYLPSTSFGKDKPPIKRDIPIARPKTRGEALRQIEAAYRHNGWKVIEQTANAAMVGLEFKPVIEYSNEELKIILHDLEKFGMIIYEN